MAKNLRKIVSMIIALAMCFSILATPASAFGWPNSNWDDHDWGDNHWDNNHDDDDDDDDDDDHGWGGNQDSDLYEWYEVYVQGKLIASGQGAPGNIYYLGTDYKAGVSTDGFMLTWYIRPNGGNAGNFGDTVDMRKYITIPEGYTLEDVVVEESSIDGVNDPYYNQYDNAVIKITVKTLLNEKGEEIEISKVTNVTVNHIYKTYDIFTGETVTDGTTSSSEGAVAGDSYTATAVPSYMDDTYQQQTDDSDLTITLVQDASANVINIEYLRTIDTTPKPAQTKVTVNHIYKTYDIYTGETVTDGTASSTADAIEGDSYTAIAAPSYKGNAYEQQTANDALTITVDADASQNIINIEYLRTIDTTPVNYIPVLDVDKIAVPGDYKVGDTVTWTITVKNISAYTAYGIVVSDELTGESWTIASLAPGAKESFTATLQNAAAGVIKNVVVASWTDNDEIPDEEEPNEIKETSDEEIVEVRELINRTPKLSVVKTAGKATYEAGETVTWTIIVKNTGDCDAYNVAIVDELTGDSWTIDVLAPGAEKSFATSLENPAAGSLKNVVIVSWEDGDEIPDEEEPNEIKETSDEELVVINDPIPENYTPVLSVIKTADKDTYEVGETVSWTITVKNTGDYAAYNVAIVDELTGDSWTIDVLAPGAEESFTTSLENPAAGSLKNVVIVSWEDGDEIPDEEEPNEIKETSDEELVTIEEPAPVNPAPLLQIIKTSNKYLFTTGETITWYITVKNVSQFPAYNVVVTDELTNDYWYVGTLEPGASRTFTAITETVTAGGITNVAVVTWTDGDDTPDNQEPNEIKRNSDDAPAIVEDPAPVVEFPVVPANDEVIIEEEDVPLAAAPKTGDISGILAAISLFSLGGMVVLNRKKDEE